jgi:hypothetical protein
MPSRTTQPLVYGEYAREGYPTTNQTSGARRKLVEVIQQLVPQFFEELNRPTGADHPPTSAPRALSHPLAR